MDAGVIETAIAAAVVATGIETSARPVAVSATIAETAVAIETVIVDKGDPSKTASPPPRTSGAENVRTTDSVADVTRVAEKKVAETSRVAMTVVVVIAKSAVRVRPNAPQPRPPLLKTPTYPSRTRHRPRLKQAATP